MQVFNYLKKIFYNDERMVAHLCNLNSQIAYQLRHDYLLAKVFDDKDLGVSSTKYTDHEIIVSLTTYGKRLYDVSITIESIMQGSMKPNKIVLWLSEDLKDKDLPITIQKQMKRGLEVSFCKDIRSYKKIIPTLSKYPDATIITIDDDVIYNYDLVERLVNEHKEHPQDVIANRVHKVTLDEKKVPQSYLLWDYFTADTESSLLNFATGVGGVLYPARCFGDEVLNEDVFCHICMFADDVWLYAMELLYNVRVRRCTVHNDNLKDVYLQNEDVQDVGLYIHNTKKIPCQNDIQLTAVFDHYKLWSKY